MSAVSVMDRIFARQPLEDPTYPLTSTALLEALRIPYESASSVVVTEKNALGMSAMWRSVNLIASGAAGLPLNAYRLSPPDADGLATPRIVTSGQAADLLAYPHPDLTAFELWELVYAHMLLWGNAYLQKLRDQHGIVRELWPIHPSRVRAGRATTLEKVYSIDNEQMVLGDEQILHIPGFGYDGVAGLSPIAAARNSIGLALAAEDFGGKFFASGTSASGIITTDQKLTQTKADQLRNRWREKTSGIQNAGNIAVLDSGAKFEKLTIPPDDAQFIQSRGFQVEEVARLYGVPLHLLMSMEKSTSWGTGIEQQTLGYIAFSLSNWLNRVEARVSKLLKPQAVYARYEINSLLRGDAAARSAYYTSMHNIGALNANEIRALEDLPPYDGGNVYMKPLNMAPPVGAPSSGGNVDAA